MKFRFHSKLGLTEEKIDFVLDQVKGAHSDAPDDALCLADEIEVIIVFLKFSEFGEFFK